MKRACASELDALAARLRVATTLRDGPEAAAPFVTYVNADATVCASARPTGAFRKVILSDGRTGYVADSALELGKPATPPPEQPDPRPI
jgi:hypothetical protein